MRKSRILLFLLIDLFVLQGGYAFQPLRPSSGSKVISSNNAPSITAWKNPFQEQQTTTTRTLPAGDDGDANNNSIFDPIHPDHALTDIKSTIITTVAITVLGTPTPALAAVAGPIPSAVFAWLHFLGILGVSGGLVAERFLIRPGLSDNDEVRISNADLVYGISAFSLLVSGYFRVTQYAKGWDYYKNEPIFWIKMSAVAILGGLSFFPTIVFFRRDILRKQGITLPPLSDALIERLTRVMNAEILALVTIPLLASLMSRGVWYTQDFPWIVGVGLYVVSLGAAGFKYGQEAFQMMEEEGALPEEKSEE